MNNTPAPEPAPLNQPLPENLTRKTPLWFWFTVTAVIALVAGLFIGNVTKAPEIKEVTKEVTVEKEVVKVPSACHTALSEFFNYGEALSGANTAYKNFISDLQGEFNGHRTAKSQYEAYGLSIGLNDQMAKEASAKLEKAMPECNEYLN